MTEAERNELAHKIAEDASKSLIECEAYPTEIGGRLWHNLRDIENSSQTAVDMAVSYLEAEGILQRFPSDSNLISWIEDETTGHSAHLQLTAEN